MIGSHTKSRSSLAFTAEANDFHSNTAWGTSFSSNNLEEIHFQKARKSMLPKYYISETIDLNLQHGYHKHHLFNSKKGFINQVHFFY